MNSLSLEIAADENRLATLKTKHLADVGQRRIKQREIDSRYGSAAQDVALVLSMLRTGHAQAIEIATKLAHNLVDIVTGPEPVVALARTSPVADEHLALAQMSLDSCAVAAAMARTLRLPKEEAQVLTLAGLLHAAGLSQLPASMRHGGKSTSNDAVETYRTYPLVGATMLRQYPSLPTAVADLVAAHRQRLDGAGFPPLAVGVESTQAALVIGIIHEYMLLTSRAEPLTQKEAIAHLFVSSRAAFGDLVVKALVTTLTAYPPGTFVELSDSRSGRVIQVNEADRMRPTVMLYDDDVPPDEAEILDLAVFRHVHVKDAINPRLAPAQFVKYFGGWSPGGIAVA